MILLENKQKLVQVALKTIDNINIYANYFSGNFSDVVIIAPGWCMTKDAAAFISISKMFAESHDVLCFDFRGHGKSSGTFTFTSKEISDLEAVIRFAKSKNYKRIHLVGFSLGAACVLIYAALNNNDVDKIIAVSPPSDFNKIENHMWKKEAWLETLKKFELNRFISIRLNIIPQRKIKPIDVITRIKSPTLFIAGDKDPTVYSWHTEKLFNYALCDKKFKLFKDGFHAEDLFLYYKQEFSNICLNWLSD